jgi:hypothetical protein
MSEIETLQQRIEEIRRSELPELVEPFPDQVGRSFRMSLNRLCTDSLELLRDHLHRKQNRPLVNRMSTRTDEQLKSELEGLKGVDIHGDKITRFGPGQDRRQADLAPRKRAIMAELKRRGIEV